MLSKSQISFIKSLHHKKYRNTNSLFIAEGLKIVSELIASDFIIPSIFCTHSISNHVQHLCSQVSKNIEIHTVSANELEKISLLSSTQEVLALVKNKETNENIIQYPVLVADTIQDPGNLGTLFRIADWFRFPTVIISENSVDWQNSKVIQASMGSFLRVDIRQMVLIDFFNINQHLVYGAFMEGTSIYEANFDSNCVLVLGNESKGICQEIAPFINEKVTIPRFGKAESLNVAIAAAVICSEICRRKINYGN